MKSGFALICGPAVAVMMVMAASCSPQKSDTPQVSSGSPVLAKVGAREILPADLLAEAELRRAAGRPVPEKSALLEEMVDEEALVQRALAMGVDRDPEVRRSWRALLIGTLKARELDTKVREAAVTPQEIQAGYEARRASFSRPEQARAGMIFISKPSAVIPQDADAALRQRAQEARVLAASGPECFQQAALKFSDHQASRYKGGDIGWVEKDRPPHRIPAMVTNAAMALPAAGAVSSVIEAEGGYYIVTLLDRRPASILPVERVEGKLSADILQRKRGELAREFGEQARRLAGVQIHAPALEGVSLPSTPSPPLSSPPAFPSGAAQN